MVGGRPPRAVRVKQWGGVSLALIAGIVVGVAAVNWPSGSEASGSEAKPTAMRLTTTVGQGPVSKMATSTGVVVAATTTNIGFRTGNNLTTLNVKVGDKVKKGQLLAEEDNAILRDTLHQDEAALANQREQLVLLLRDPTVRVDKRIDKVSFDAVQQAKRNIFNQVKADQDAVERAKGVLRFDERALALAKAQARADGCYPNSSLVTVVVSVASSATCVADLQAVNAAKQTLYNDRTTVIADENTLRIDEGNLKSALLAALLTAVTNQGAYDIAKVDRPINIKAQEDLVRQAEAVVAFDRNTLDFSYVYAPVDGTVTAVTGTVGEYMNGGSLGVPVSPLAPGSHAMIPDVGAPAAADLAAGDSSQGIFPLEALRGTAPAGGAFIQLGDLDTLQVVVPFPETDIAKVQPGSAAKLTFPALAGLVEDGTVTSVAPAAVELTNKINYYATILLTDKDPRLKPGMSSDVSVVTQTIENKALVVPTSAVTDQDGHSYVNVLGPDGTPRRTVFTKGKVGDDNSEVLSGLTAGQKVILPPTGPLPQPRPSAAKTPAPRPNTIAPTNGNTTSPTYKDTIEAMRRNIAAHTRKNMTAPTHKNTTSPTHTNTTEPACRNMTAPTHTNTTEPACRNMTAPTHTNSR
jgi:HlyD family secretion protein